MQRGTCFWAAQICQERDASLCQQLARQVVQSLIMYNRICYSLKHCDSQASLPHSLTLLYTQNFVPRSQYSLQLTAIINVATNLSRPAPA